MTSAHVRRILHNRRSPVVRLEQRVRRCILPLLGRGVRRASWDHISRGARHTFIRQCVIAAAWAVNNRRRHADTK